MNILKKIVSFVGSFGSSPNKVAQAAHFLAGYSVLLTTSIIWHAVWPGILIIVAWSTVKEAYIDTLNPPYGESAPYFWDGFEDQAFYLLGSGLGMLTAWLLSRLS